MINITIDGPVGAGKSSVADEVAKRLNIYHLDTGAMYRAFAYCAKNNGVSENDEEAVKALISQVKIGVKFINNIQHTFANDTDVNEYIRTPEISMLASTLSKQQCVREKLVDAQRKIAMQYDVILDGRDTGTNVLTSSPLKIYLTADAKIRAKRREKQYNTGQSYEEILADIEKRDKQDSTRAINPLKIPENAVVIDSSHMNFDDTVNLIIEHAKKIYKDELSKI